MTEAWHGTVSAYNNRKCRCDRCREAKRLYQLEQRHPGDTQWPYRESLRTALALFREKRENLDATIAFLESELERAEIQFRHAERRSHED